MQGFFAQFRPLRSGACQIGAAFSGVVMTALLVCPAMAQNKPDGFFAGRQINILAGSSAGGGYDTYARLLSRHFGRHIPGHPTIVVQNMPGAGGKVVTAYIANVAPKDGTAIAATYPQALTEPLFGERKKFKYDPETLSYVGSMNGEPYYCFVTRNSPVQKIEDLRSKEFLIGGSAPGASTMTSPALLSNLLGLKFRVIAGYKGSREITLAAMQGEVHGWCGMGWSASQATVRQQMQSGDIRILFQENGEFNDRVRDMKLARATDMTSNAEDRRILDIVYSQQLYGRPYIAPSGMDPARLEILRRAFDATILDPQMIADAKKLNLDLRPISGADLTKTIVDLYATPQALVEKAKAALDITRAMGRK